MGRLAFPYYSSGGECIEIVVVMASPHPALIELAAGRDLPAVEDVDGFLRSAREHRLHGVVWDQIQEGRFSLPHRAELVIARWQLQARAHHQRLWKSLEDAVGRLESIGLGVATAKGVTAESRWYPGIGARPTLDVDLLLRPSDIRRSGDAVFAIDPEHRLRGVVAYLAEDGHLQSVDLRDELGSHIDLHFDILKYEVATRQIQLIWDRTQYLVTPSGGGVRVLDPETSLVLFLLHLNKDRFSHLLGFVDIVRLIDQEELDWDFIDRFLRTEGIDTHVYLALDTVFGTLGLPPPAHPTPSGWRAATWRRLWSESVRLGGDQGRLSHPRRQYWIAATARGRSVEAASRWLRRVFPSRALLDYHHPGLSGAYLTRLALGRRRSARQRREVIAALDDAR